MAELGRVDAGLHLEFLNRVDRRKHYVGGEVRVRVGDTVQSEIVEHNAIAAGGDGLRRAVAALAPARLARIRRQGVDVRRQGDQAQVVAAGQRKLGDAFVFDDS